MARRDFANTSPYHIHESRPMPLPACGTEACRHGRGAPRSTGCADVIAAQAEGARMARGDQRPSKPMKLRMTDQEIGEAGGNVIGWPLGVLAAVATVAAVAAVLRTAMF